MRKRARQRALAPLIFVLACQASNSAAATIPSGDGIYPLEFTGLYSCVVDRVLAGPNGEVAAWWGDDRQLLGSMVLAPGLVIIGRMHDPARRAEDRLRVYGGGSEAFYPVRWSGRDGHLFIRTRGPESRILSIDADGGPVKEIANLGAAWRWISLDAVGHGNVDALLRPSAASRARQVDGASLVRGHATLGGGLRIVAARRSDLELVRVGAAGAESAGINAGQTRSLTLFPNAKDYPDGIAYLGAPSRSRSDYIPYQLPLIDQSTGRIAGMFGPTTIQLDGRRGLARTLADFRRVHRDGRMILDASLSGRTLVALTLSGRGNRAIVRMSPAGYSETPICTDVIPIDLRRRTSPNPLASPDTDYRPSFAFFSLDDLGREGSEPGRPILATSSLGGGPARDAILRFHGGPGVSNADSDFQLAQLGSLLKPGRDIVSVEYSGSVGGGRVLTERLGKSGLAALRQDADAIVRWLERRGYRRVFIVASSFGGVPALVAIERHRERFQAAFFFAPLLRLPEPQDHVDRGRFHSASADTQLSFERALLGGAAGRERFKDELAALVERAPLTASDRFYFAERDPVSRPADLPPATAAIRKVIPGTNHMVISATPSAWREIEDGMR